MSILDKLFDTIAALSKKEKPKEVILMQPLSHENLVLLNQEYNLLSVTIARISGTGPGRNMIQKHGIDVFQQMLFQMRCKRAEIEAKIEALEEFLTE